jgi:hypothetical protein
VVCVISLPIFISCVSDLIIDSCHACPRRSVPFLEAPKALDGSLVGGPPAFALGIVR